MLLNNCFLARWEQKQNCTSLACKRECAVQHPTGRSDADALDICSTFRCAAECG